MAVPALFHISVMNSLVDLSLWHAFSTLCGLFRFCVWRLSGWTKKTFYQHSVTAYKVNRVTTAAFETVLSNWNKLKHRCMSMLICICHLFTCNSWHGIEFFAFEFLLQKLINGLISHPILVSSSDYCLFTVGIWPTYVVSRTHGSFGDRSFDISDVCLCGTVLATGHWLQTVQMTSKNVYLLELVDNGALWLFVS